jgi:hypothetical protein
MVMKFAFSTFILIVNRIYLVLILYDKKKAPRKINCLKVKIYELKGSNKKLKVKKYYYQIGLILLRSLRSIFSLTMLSLLERIFSLYDFLLDFSLMDFI